MWIPIFFALWAASEPEPAGPSPATAVVMAVSEKAGATNKDITLVTTGLGPGDDEALRAAFAQSGMFVLVDRAKAQVVVAVTRQDAAGVTLTVTAADGKTLHSGKIDWPAPLPAPVEDAEAVYRKVLHYQRERLRVVPVVRGYTGSPMVVGGWASNWFGNPMPWGLGFGGAVPVSTMPNDWVIMRGAAQPVDEMEVAQKMGDERLAERIEDGRFWPRVWWAAGFGAGALAAVGAGSYIHERGGQDDEALGVSLITVGVVSGVLALLAPTLGKRHVLSAAEAQTIADAYNEKLRAQVGVSPDDVARYPETP